MVQGQTLHGQKTEKSANAETADFFQAIKTIYEWIYSPRYSSNAHQYMPLCRSHYKNIQISLIYVPYSLFISNPALKRLIFSSQVRLFCRNIVYISDTITVQALLPLYRRTIRERISN
jgi:hypothetical protein